MNNRIFPLALCSTLVLSACGGGGGGGGAPAAPVAPMSVITTANVNKAAATAYAGTAAVSESSSSLSGLLTGVSVGGGNVGVVRPALKLIWSAYPRVTGRLLTGATVTVTEACPGGGSMTVDAKVRDEEVASNGDTITVTARNCVADGDTVNGSVSATLSNVNGDVFNSWNWSATLDASFANFAATSGGETVSINGDMKIAITQTSSTNHRLNLSGKSLQTTMQRNNVNVGSVALTDYSMNGSTSGTTVSTAASFVMSGSNSTLGQFSYTVRNLQPFLSNAGAMPYTGAMAVSGASSSVTLSVASNSTVRLDFSAKGDGVTTQTNILSWTQLFASL